MKNARVRQDVGEILSIIIEFSNNGASEMIKTIKLPAVVFFSAWAEQPVRSFSPKSLRAAALRCPGSSARS